MKNRTIITKDIIISKAVKNEEIVSDSLMKPKVNFSTRYETKFMNKSFRLISAPEIETRIEIIRAARVSPEIITKSILKKGVSFRMSEITTRNITKIAKRTRASLTEIFVLIPFRLNPKKVPIIVCQVSDIIIVSFQGLMPGFVVSSWAGIINSSPGSCIFSFEAVFS